MIPKTVALEEYLFPLEAFLNDVTVSEIIINRPGKVLIENKNGFSEHEAPGLDWRHLTGLADLIGRFSEQYLNEKKPLLSGILPSGHRVQIVLPPATQSGHLIMAIRKQTLTDVSLDHYVEMGTFQFTKPVFLEVPQIKNIGDEETLQLKQLFYQHDYPSFLKAAIVAKKNILISGATSTGKTTFLNACLKEIPANEHIVTLEDVAEVKPPHPYRHSSLFTSKGEQGTAKVTMQHLVEASLRLKPDRIIMGELRGAEAADFINATATGHDGSISSIHAASPQMAFMRLVHMVKLSGTNLSREDILEDLHTVIDIVVQLKRRMINGRICREVSGIYYADAVSQESKNYGIP
jgi:type IV secretion system protein VirB11